MSEELGSFKKVSKNPVMRVHNYHGKLVVVLDRNIVARFGSSINEESYVEQMLVNGGILLKPVLRNCRG